MNEQIFLTESTREALVEEITEKVLAGVKEILLAAREKDLNAKEWLSSKEARDFLKISPVTLWSWSKEGIIESHKIGSRIRYRRDQLVEAIKSKHKRKD